MRISTITNWAYGATVLLTGLAGGAFILSAVAGGAEREAVERHLALDTLGEELALHSEIRSDEARLYVMRGAERHRAAFRREEQEAHRRERVIAGLRVHALAPAEAAALDEAVRNLDELDAIERAAVSQAEAGNAEAGRAALFGPDHERAQTGVLEPVRRFRALVATRTGNELDAARGRADGYALAARIMLAVTAALFLAVLYFVLRRRVALPLSRMTGVVMRLARQDYSVEVPRDRRADEIGEMTRAVHIFRDNGLERDRLEAERAADRRAKDAILQMMHRLQATETQAELAEVVACFVPLTFPDLAGHLYVLDRTHSGLALAASWLDPVEAATSFPPSACWALRRGRPHGNGCDDSDIPCPHLLSAALPSLCVPLTVQGDTIGLLYFEARGQAAQIEDASRLYLELIAENIGLALSNLRLREQLMSLATHDALTGLSNRRCLDEALNRAVKAGEPLACLMIDIDHFKLFNDRFGHDAGDMVMQHVARVMLETVGGDGQVYRFGGEEFTVLLPAMGAAAAEAVADRLRGVVHATPLAYRGRALGHVSVSIGVAAAPQDGPLGDLLSSADAALLAAKDQGRDRVVTIAALSRPPAA